MLYRPQFCYPDPPEGWVDEEFEYYFDTSNTLGLTLPAVGQLSAQIVLQMLPDADFLWRATQISGNTGPLCIRFYDPQGRELSAVIVEADRAYSGYLGAQNPVGRLPVPFEPEIRIPAGGFLMVDLLTL